jgi:S-adenosylmethionine hydrolase
MARQIVTLTTDFGHNDHFVGVIKGVILKLAPETEIVDICHDVRPYDILDGAFTLVQAYRYFPTWTIHMVVVDPGVGTARRPILANSDGHWFVAPDNGVLSFMYSKEPDHKVRHITSEHYFLSPVSQTFQARDVFAPVVGWMARGVESQKFGEYIEDYVKFAPPKPKVISEKAVQGVVLKVDRFGNLITNLTPEDLPALFQENPPAFKMIVGKTEVTKLNLNYAQSPANEVFIIVGSSGYLELSTNRGSAARILQVDRGAQVGVMFA